MTKSTRVPEAMQARFDSISAGTDAFCERFLNDECKQLIRLATAALCRKRPSPLLKARENSWAAGIVHAVGMVNFLFDAGQTPHCKAPDIYAFFGVGASTGQAKSMEVRTLLKMRPFDHHWMLPSKIGNDTAVIWMVQLNGVIVDARTLPREVQEIAHAKGLIPYVPDDKP